MEPGVVLLDEPLASLDAHLREAMQQEFARFHREIGATFIYVTHDQAEAMALADRVAVMNAGRVEQAAAPRTLYREPATEMVAGFVGHGMVLPVTVLGRDGARTMVELWGTRVAVRGAGEEGERRKLCLHAEDIAIVAAEAKDAAQCSVPCRVVGAAYQGASTLLTVQPSVANGPPLKVAQAGDPPMTGASVAVTVRDGWLIPGRSVP
jgi:iron(III) transport system ATP-binding protein